MKQNGDVFFVFPKKLPRTFRGLSAWNKRLLDTCMLLEFKKRALNAALEKINEELKHYVPYLREEPVALAARQALDALNRLKVEFQEELEVAKHSVKVTHDTNEQIIGFIIKKTVGQEMLEQLLKTEHPESNLLHGDGWLFEVASAELMRKKGYEPFIAFGTVFDSALKMDVLAVKSNARLEWNLPTLRKLRRTSKTMKKPRQKSTTPQ